MKKTSFTQTLFTKALCLFIIICFSQRVISQSCETYPFTFSSDTYCWYGNTNMKICSTNVNNTSSPITYFIHRRRAGQNTWTFVGNRSIATGNDCLSTITMSTLVPALNTAVSPLPNTDSVSYDFVITLSNIPPNSCTGLSNIIHATFLPVPAITAITPPISATAFIHCFNQINTDTLRISVVDSLAQQQQYTYEWKLNKTGSVNDPVYTINNGTNITRNFYIPATNSACDYCFYRCNATNRYGCSSISAVSVNNVTQAIPVTKDSFIACSLTDSLKIKGVTFYKTDYRAGCTNCTVTKDDTAKATNGCISINKISLGYYPVNAPVNQSASICYHQDTIFTWKPFTGKTKTYTITNNTPSPFTDTARSPNGPCFSLYNLSLTINKPDTTRKDTAYCYALGGERFYIYDNYFSNKIYLTRDTSFSYLYSSRLKKCDSLLVMKLKIDTIPNNFTVISSSLCSKDSVLINNGWYYGRNGTNTYYSYRKYAGTNCDSIKYKITITVKPNTQSSQSRTICSSQLPYTWYSKIFTSAGTQTITGLTNSTGCDSSVVLNLVVKAVYIQDTFITTCRKPGRFIGYIWTSVNGTRVFFNSTTFRDSLHTGSGCDSIIVVHLTINPYSIKDTIIYTCRSCTVHIWNEDLYNEGMHEVMQYPGLQNSKGCDSVLHVYLIKNMLMGDTMLCNGDTGYYYATIDSGYKFTFNSDMGIIRIATGDSDRMVSFNSSGLHWVAVTAVDTTKNNLVVYRDTVWVRVGDRHVPNLASTHSVGCWTYNDSALNEQGVWVYIFDSSGCINACEKTAYTYYAVGRYGSQFKWRVIGGTKVKEAGDSVVVVWGTAGTSARLIVTEITPTNCEDSVQYCFKLNSSPIANIATNLQGKVDTVIICKRQTITFVDSSKANGSYIKDYIWNFGDGKTSTFHGNVSNVYDTNGHFWVTQEVFNGCGCSSKDSLLVIVIDSNGVNIKCERTVCENSTQFYTLDIPYVTNCSFGSGWGVIGGHIIDTFGNSVKIKWDSVPSNGTGIVKYTTTCPYLCPGTSSINIGIIKTNGVTITGSNSICTHTPVLYHLPFWNNASYSWSVNAGATILGTGLPNEVFIVATGATDSIELSCHFVHNIDSCYGDAHLMLGVQPAATVSSTVSALCLGDSIKAGASIAVGNWQWQVTLPNSSVVLLPASDSLMYLPTMSGKYSITIIGSNNCTNTAATIMVNDKPQNLIIAGDSSVCVQDEYVYSVVNTQTGVSYTWGVKGQTSIDGQNTGETVQLKHTGSINPNASFNASVWVIGSNEGGCVSDSSEIKLHRLVISNTITASSNVACPNSQTVFAASYKNGEYYDWSVSPASVGSIERGQGTDSLTVQWNNSVSGTITVQLRIRKCGSSGFSVSSYQMNIAPNPVLTINRRSGYCRGDGANFQLLNNGVELSGATVKWNYGDGSVETTGSIGNHIYTEVISSPKTYTVTALITGLSLNGCVNVASNISITKTITINPTPKATEVITGTNFCNRNIAHSLDITIDTSYGSADSLIWNTPGGNVNCASPFSAACLSLSVDTGRYSYFLKNSYGCVNRGFTYNFYCPLICQDTIQRPQISITGDTIATCGALQLTGTTNRVVSSHSWELNAHSETYNNVSSSNYSNFINTPGKYMVNFRTSYIKTSGIDSGAVCTTDTSFNVIAPVVPKLSKTISCNGSTYQLKLADNSGSYTGTSNIIYKFYVDGSLVQNSSSNTYTTTISAGVQHITGLTVTYTYAGNNYSCSTAPDTLAALPAIPTAHFTTSAKHCEGIPIRFTYSGTYNNAYSYVWDFGDGATSLRQNPVKSYEFISNPTFDFPSLTINTGYCIIKYQDTINVVQNRLDGSINDGNYIICPNTNFSVVYTPDFLNPNVKTPDVYKWFDARGTNITTPIQINTGSTNNSYTATSNGAYWVLAGDNDGCIKPIDKNAVIIVKQLPTPTITSVPTKKYGDTLQLCVNSSLSLSTEQTNNIVDCSWYINGQQYSTGSNTISFAANSLPADSIYNIYVVATHDIDNGQSCTSQSRMFVVKVNNVPQPPTIAPFNALDCKTYSIGLTASSSTPGIFTWSNGYSNNLVATQSSIVVNRGGTYSVALSTGNGCTSRKDTVVPNSVRDYLNTLVNGCYRLCIGNSGFVLPLASSSPAFNSWQWLYNWQPYIHGYHSPVAPLTITGSGTYTLAANNGLCTDTAFNAIIEVSQPANCAEYSGCNYAASADNGGRNATCDSAYIIIGINNINQKAAPYYITINGVSVQGGVVQPGKSFDTIMVAAAACGEVFTAGFYFYQTIVGVTKLCDSIFVSVTTDPCPTCRVAQPTVAKANKTQELKKTYLFVQPTVAKDECRIYYKFDGAKATQNRTINLYNSIGSLIKTYTVQQQQGNGEHECE